MKLADIPDPLLPMAVVNYAAEHKYKVQQFLAQQEDPADFTKMILDCLDHARKKNCVEYCFAKVERTYDLRKDFGHIWRISIYGFVPK